MSCIHRDKCHSPTTLSAHWPSKAILLYCSSMWRYRIARFIFGIAQIILARVIVEGRENIPQHGPYIVATNHMSTADSVLVFLAFPLQEWRFFAGEKWASHPIWGLPLAWLGAIYVNRGEVDRRALREALAALAEGTPFALAPEGTRSKVGVMQPAKDGASFLAAQSKVPILPVGINDSDRLFANARKLRRSTLTLRIGEPFTLPDLGRRPRGRDLSAYTCLIMTHIAALVNPRHRGAYGDSPALQSLLAGNDPWPDCLSGAAAPPSGTGKSGDSVTDTPGR